MKVIDYSPDGEAIPDHAAEDRARQFLRGEQERICVSTDNFITASRALVYEGFIPHTEIQFTFKGGVIAHNKDARMEYWPKGFCDWSEDWLCRLLSPRTPTE